MPPKRKTTSLPAGLAQQLESIDSSKFQKEHNLGKRKNRKESRRELRKQKRQKHNHHQTDVKKDLKVEKPEKKKPKSDLKEKSKKSDEFLAPLVSLNELEQRDKIDEEEAYYARMLGKDKDVDLDDLGLDEDDEDSMGEDMLSESEGVHNVHEDDELSEGDFESEVSDEEMTAEETMAKLKALKEKKQQVRVEESPVEDDSLSEGDFESEFDESGNEMTAEETMAKLMALKGKKSNADTGSHSDFGSDFGSESESGSDAEENPYIPPKLREKPKIDMSVSTENTRMIKLFRSALNKLTEPTLNAVFNDITRVFSEYSLTESSATLTNQIIDILTPNQPLQPSLIVVYGCLISKLYDSYGTQFAAVFVQQLVETMLKQDSQNFGMMISEIYAFQIVSSKLLYDLITFFINKHDEKSVEMVLTIIRSVGPNLRHDDPYSLKEVILNLQQTVQTIGRGNLSPRMQFLVDQIMMLKNNRNKVSEVVLQLRNQLRKQHKIVKEAMNVSLNDILNAETRGKWWLVGASWRGNTHDGDNNNEDSKIDTDVFDDLGTTNWLEIARKQRLNTDSRRALFVAIMGAEDYLEACLRIDKINLNSKQQRDIPYVLLHCLSQEKAYNPYYAFVASKLCAKHQTMKTFQFTLWDWLQTSASPQIAMHYGRFYAQLVAAKVMPLDVLKNMDFLSPSESNKIFLELFLVNLYTKLGKEAEKMGNKGFSVRLNANQLERDGKELTLLLSKTKDPKVLRGLQLVNPQIENSEALQSGKDVDRVKWACGLVNELADMLVHKLNSTA